jgi:hypothetical protein
MTYSTYPDSLWKLTSVKSRCKSHTVTRTINAILPKAAYEVRQNGTILTSARET